MTTAHAPDSRYSWVRLAISLALSTIGGIGLWSAVVVLPTIQAEFAIDRAGASLPYTVTTIGFAIGGLLMGRLADRFGIAVPLFAGAIALGAGFILAALSGSFLQFLIVQALRSASWVLRPLSVRWSPMSPCGFINAAASPSPSWPAAIIWRAPSGRRSCNMASPPMAGARSMRQSACSVSPP
jgi:MFS family permease